MLRPQNSRLCTVAESATKLRMSQNVVRMPINAGDLPGIQLGGRIVVVPSRLEEWMSSKVAATSTFTTPKSGHELIETVLAAEHHTVVLYPSMSTRRLWRRAIWQASNEGLVPAGLRLRHAGRDGGALIVGLVPVTDKPPKEAVPIVAVPSALVRPEGSNNSIDAARVIRDARDEPMRAGQTQCGPEGWGSACVDA